MRVQLSSPTRSNRVTRVIQGFAELGYVCEKTIVHNAQDLGLPAMLFVDHATAGPESHAVSLMALEADSAEIWDPMSGRATVSTQALRQIWHRRAITCRWPVPATRHTVTR